MAVSTVTKGNGSVKTITWTDCTTTDKAPDTDINICLKHVDYCTIQVDSVTAAAHTSANWDVNVYSSPDGTNWDTTKWDGADGFGNDAMASFAVTPGPAWIRLRLDCNANRADVTARVYIR